MDQEKKFLCPECGKRYKTKDNLNVHHRASHLAERVSCSVCGQTFSTETNCQRHVRQKHSPELRFKCNGCSSTFTRKDALERHQRLCCPNGNTNPQKASNDNQDLYELDELRNSVGGCDTVEYYEPRAPVAICSDVTMSIAGHEPTLAGGAYSGDSRESQGNAKSSSASTGEFKGATKRDMHEIEGTLEMQRMLLQKLAQKENTAKGLISKWPGRGPGGQRIMASRWEASEPTTSVSDADFETCRKEVALAISTIWRR